MAAAKNKKSGQADPISERERALNQQISSLEAEIKKLDSQIQKAPTQPNPSARSSPRKPLYQILIKHDSGSCPSLPDDYGFLYTQENEYRCPVHLVFAAPCVIDQARLRIEVLKRVPGLVRIWLTKDGYGVPLDDWSKGPSVWQRTE